MVKDLRELSQLDPGGVAKHVHDELGRSIRVSQANSEVPSGFSRVNLSTNAQGSVTEAVFYAGITTETTRIRFVGDIAGSLNNTYFLINAGEDNPQFYVWYNVDGLGTDPDLAGKCGLEVLLNSNDSDAIVALATKQILNYTKHFNIETNGDKVILITTRKKGQTTNSSDVSTGFTVITLVEGITERIKCITLPEEADFVYKFNHAEGKFEYLYTGAATAEIANTPNIQNVAMTTANTEYNFSLPVGTKQWRLKNRGMGKVQYTFQSGDSDTNFFTLSPGAVHNYDSLALGAGLTVYVRNSKDGEVLEVISWK